MHHTGLRRLVFPVLALILVAAATVAAVAQEGEDEERSRFVRFVERQISTPDRQIRLGGIEGALSSNVRLDSITIADRDGVWLRIEGVHLVWSRSALLRRRLEVERLEADRIAVERAPRAADGPSQPLEERTFELPEFPLTFDVGEIRVPRIEIAAGVVADQAYDLSLAGSGRLESGALDLDVAVERLDGAGELQIEAGFAEETRVLDLHLLFSEPRDGLVANLLNLQGRPAVTLEVTGSAPIDDFTADISLTADGEEIISGDAAITSPAPGSHRLAADLGGSLERLVPPAYAELVDEGSRLTIDATRAADGSIAIAGATLRSGVAVVEVSGELAPDGVPTALDVTGSLGTAEGTPVTLPVGEGPSTVNAARLEASLGGEGGGWTAELALDALATPALSIGRLTIAGGGTAAEMADPEARSLTFDVTGRAEGVEAEGLPAAIGAEVDLRAQGAWGAGQGFRDLDATLQAGGGRLNVTGVAGEALALSGDFEAVPLALLNAVQPDLEAAGILSGTLELGGTREVPIAVFDLQGRGVAVALTELVGLDPVDIEAEGRFADETLTIDAEALVAGRTLSLDGTIGEALDVTLGIDAFPLDMVEGLAPGLDPQGRISAELHATGTLAAPRASFGLSGEGVTLGLLQDLGLPPVELTAEGRFEDGAAELTRAVLGIGSGRIEIEGAVGEIVDLRARLDAIPLSIAGAALPGLDPQGTISGTAEVAGFVLDPEAEFELTGSGVTLAPLSEAGVPPGELSISGAYAAGAASLSQGMFEIAGGRLDLQGEVWPALDVAATLDALPLSLARGFSPALDVDGTVSGRAEATGSPFEPQAEFDLQASGITNAGLAQAGIEAASLRARGSHGQGTTTLEEILLEAGEGRIEARAALGDEIDLHATLSAFPAAAIRAVRPDLPLTGTLSGTLTASGPTGDPVLDFELTGSAISGLGAGAEAR
ncbi:hypothetical protein [Lutibaculum baratangense]|uniref:Uncharacterized protein n=1 Tax=Lutibaculum baratangense AMV1 TaxID=631454 RepID=V4R946_9HYPH|nr:hypothetical protein [Lutibaculum baratangense]ESR22721.1 hypothetical protein N177_3858 [Lutibaculum baratangense AMV1]